MKLIIQPLPERLDDISAKISLASFIASDQNTLGEQPRMGFYLLLHDQSEALREIADELRKITHPGKQERKES